MFDNLLRHTVTIRRAALGDENDYGHRERTPTDLTTVKALVQPRMNRIGGGASEEPTTYFGGTEIHDHTIFMRPTDVTAQDQIYATDAGIHTGRTFEVILVKDAGGQDHHLEVDARLIVVPEV